MKILLSIQAEETTTLGDPANYAKEIRKSLQTIRDEFRFDGVVLDEQFVLNGETSDQCGLLKVRYSSHSLYTS